MNVDHIDRRRLRFRAQRWVQMHVQPKGITPTELRDFAYGLTLPPEKLELLAQAMGLLPRPPCTAKPKPRRQEDPLTILGRM